jgi:hypothetical protein
MGTDFHGENPYGPEYEIMREHAHWATYDMKLEGSRYNRLEVLVGATPFDAAAAEAVVADLVEMASGKGWGEQDSFSCEMSGKTEGEVEAAGGYNAAILAQFRDDPDSQYTHEVMESCRILRSAAVTQEALLLISDIPMRIEDARTAGRNNYISRNGPVFASAPPPGP